MLMVGVSNGDAEQWGKGGRQWGRGKQWDGLS